jgi:alkylation response protein AidB-like acyl-CoA dehydrogenase
MRMHAADSAEEAIEALLGRLDGVAEASRANAQKLDRSGIFPVADVTALTRAGALGAVAPTLMGGLGIGTEPARANATARVLRMIGSGSVALGRIYEGHVNAVRLVMRNGTAAQQRRTANDARAGHLHALWVTDGPDPVRLRDEAGAIALTGEKMFCSAAGYASRAVITAADADGAARMVLVSLGGAEEVRKLSAGLQGVRSAGTGRVGFTGVTQPQDAVMGQPGAYLAEPEFSAGAWRASAVVSGALSALVETARAELQSRGRAGAPEQRQRLGQLFMHAETARLWVMHAAPVAEDANPAPDFATATVNLARTAIESACLESINLVQRSLGLSAFLQSNPVERQCRDIATYLRQPAPDEALAMAAAYFTTHPQVLGFP